MYDSNPPSNYREFASLAMLLVGLAVAWPAWEEMLRAGWQAANNSHILLAPMVAAYLLWDRRSLFLNLSGCWRGTAILGTGVITIWLGEHYHRNAFYHLGAIVTAVGAVATTVHPRGLRTLLAASGALLFMIPVPGIAIDRLSFPLVELTAYAVAGILNATVCSAEVCGNLIRLECSELTVTQACGGLPLLMGTFVMTYGVCAAMPLTVAGIIITFAAAPLVSLVGNITRITIVAWFYDREMVPLADLLHDIGGLLIVGAAWLIPYLLARLLTLSAACSPSAHSPSVALPEAVSSPRKWRRSPILTSLVLLSLGAASHFDITSTSHEQSEPHVNPQIVIDRVPYRIQKWFGTDVDLPESQITVLRPDGLLNRRFVQIESGATFLLTVVVHNNGNAHAGHRAAKCYQAIGWHTEDERERAWMMGNETIQGTVHSMLQQSQGQSRRLTVIEIVMAQRQDGVLGNEDDGPNLPTIATARILLVFDDKTNIALRDETVLHALESLNGLSENRNPVRGTVESRFEAVAANSVSK